MSILEAISIGLPVIVTNTGGMPDVVGTPNEFAHIVPEQDSEAMCQAIKKVFNDRLGLKNNFTYAKQRIELFSQARQTHSCINTYAKIVQNKKNIRYRHPQTTSYSNER